MVEPTSKRVRVPGGAGALGRDKVVEFRQATHAKVRYLLDRSWVHETVTASEAAALVEQAERAGHAAAARGVAAAERRQAAAAEVQRKLADLACPICGGRDFDEQQGREDSQWGMTTLRMQLLICRQCAYVLQFARGTSLFVPGR